MKTPPKDIADEDVQKLLNYFGQEAATLQHKYNRQRNLTMILLMLDTGIRVGELVKLQWSQLIYGEKVVSTLVIPAAVAKTKVERQIPLTTRAQEAIDKLQKLWSGQWPPEAAESPFTGGNNFRSLTVRQVERIIGTAAQALTGKWIKPHQLRHTFATKMMRITNIRVVQQLLGHKRLSSTMIYTHVNSKDLKDAILSLDSENAKTPTVQN